MRRVFPLLGFGMAALALPAPRCAAQATAHYFDVNSLGTAFHARVNGYEICQTLAPEGFSHSRFLTPYLVKGRNRVVITSRALGGAGPDEAWVQLEIASAPADKIRTAEDPGRFLLERRISPAEPLRFPASGEGDFTVLAGETTAGTGPLRFQATGERRWAWGLRIDDRDRRIDGRPSKLVYSGLNQTLAMAEVHFIDSATGNRLAFQGLKLAAGGGEVALDDASLARGLDSPEDATFDTVWIFGFSALGVDEVRLLAFDLVDSPGVRQLSEEFTVELPHVWAWEEGAVLSGIATDAALREEAIAFLERLHSTVDGRPAAEWVPFFEIKTGDFSKASGTPVEKVGEGQLRFFESLAATEGWKLEPFDPSRLLLQPVNDRVLAVSYVDSDGPLLSVPLKKPGGDQLDRLKIPLFISKIGGKWNVVR
jgi:hypothetical protein